MARLDGYMDPSDYSSEITPEGVLLTLAAQALVIGGMFAYESIKERLEERRNGYAAHNERFRKEQMRKIQQKEEELKKKWGENEKHFNDINKVIGMIHECIETVNQLPHSKLFVKENNETFKNLEQCERFINDTLKEGHTVSIAFTRQAYKAAQEYETSAIEFEKRWENACEEWNRVWQQTSFLIEEGRRVTIRLNTDAGEETAEIDSNFWTRGEFESAAKELPERERGDETTIREFSELTAKTRTLFTRIEGAIEQAGREFDRCLVRRQMAEAVCDELYARGWFCENEDCFAFMNDDQRESVILRIQNPAHDELEMTFTTDSNLLLEYRFAGVHNRDVIARLVESIRAALERIDVRVDQFSQKV